MTSHTSPAAPAAPTDREVTMLDTATPTPTACPDCGGQLVRAFDATDAYDRCRRCGHVFAADLVVGVAQVDR